METCYFKNNLIFYVLIFSCIILTLSEILSFVNFLWNKNESAILWPNLHSLSAPIHAFSDFSVGKRYAKDSQRTEKERETDGKLH